MSQCVEVRLKAEASAVKSATDFVFGIISQEQPNLLNIMTAVPVFERFAEVREQLRTTILEENKLPSNTKVIFFRDGYVISDDWKNRTTEVDVQYRVTLVKDEKQKGPMTE